MAKKKEDIFEKVPDWVNEYFPKDKEPHLWTFKKWERHKDTHPLPYVAYDKEKEITTLVNVNQISCRSSPSYQEYPLECYIEQKYGKGDKVEYYGRVINDVGAILSMTPSLLPEINGDVGGDYIYSTLNFNEPTKCKISKGNYDHILILCEKDPNPVELRLDLTRPKKRE